MNKKLGLQFSMACVVEFVACVVLGSLSVLIEDCLGNWG